LIDSNNSQTNALITNLSHNAERKMTGLSRHRLIMSI